MHSNSTDPVGDLIDRARNIAWFERPRKPRSAIKLLRQALEIEPASARAHLLIGDILNALKSPRHAEAERAYREALRLAPQSAEPHGRLAALLWDTDRREGAIEAYREAFHRDPADGRWCVGLGAGLLALGRHQEATSLLEQALSLKRICEPSVRSWLADAYVLSGQRERALEQWRIIERNGAVWDEDRWSVANARRMLRDHDQR